MRNSSEMNVVKFMSLIKRMTDPNVNIREVDKTPDDIILEGFDRLTDEDQLVILKLIANKSNYFEEDKKVLTDKIDESNDLVLETVADIKVKLQTFLQTVFIIVCVLITLIMLFVIFDPKGILEAVFAK